MRWWLLGLFLLLPVVELALIIEVGRAIGSWAAVLLVIFTGVLGSALAHSQGLFVLWRIQHELHSGRMPAAELLHGLLILIGGLLLVVPGLLTDLVGFALLWPRVRRRIILALELRIRAWLRDGRLDIRFWR